MKMESPKMRLYLWRDVLCDYTPGMAFGVASSKENAIEIISDHDYVRRELLEKEPEVYELGTPVGAYVEGGG